MDRHQPPWTHPVLLPPVPLSAPARAALCCLQLQAPLQEGSGAHCAAADHRTHRCHLQPAVPSEPAGLPKCCLACSKAGPPEGSGGGVPPRDCAGEAAGWAAAAPHGSPPAAQHAANQGIVMPAGVLAACALFMECLFVHPTTYLVSGPLWTCHDTDKPHQYAHALSRPSCCMHRVLQ